MGLRKVLTSVKHAVFGKPVTYEEARAAERADLANRRHTADTEARAHAIRNSGYIGL